MTKKPLRVKKTYRPPKIESRAIYEVNALGCAKCPAVGQIALTTACIRGVKKYS